MIPEGTPVWFIIVALGVGTFLIRFSFIGLVGDRALPDWLLRHLRYTAVTVIPALVAPMLVWPAATDGQPDPARLAAGLATLAVGYWTRSTLWAILAGAGVLTVLLSLG
jgi:branched-subunit amino acid transport protein